MLEAIGLGHEYRQQSIFTDLSFRLDEGLLFGLTGESGSGKSTLLSVLGLLLQPSRGFVRLDGVNLTAQPDAVRSRARAIKFGFVFQDAVLDPSRTVLANVLEAALYSGTPRTRVIARAIELTRELGVEHRLGARPTQVSGGQAQRIALCRALLLRPKVIIADEPTGNLDVKSATVVLNMLRQHTEEGGIVIIATHDAGVRSECDRVLQL